MKRAFIGHESTEGNGITAGCEVVIYAKNLKEAYDIWFSQFDGMDKAFASKDEYVFDNGEVVVDLGAVREIPISHAKILEKYLATYK